MLYIYLCHFCLSLPLECKLQEGRTPLSCSLWCPEQWELNGGVLGEWITERVEPFCSESQLLGTWTRNKSMKWAPGKESEPEKGGWAKEGASVPGWQGSSLRSEKVTGRREGGTQNANPPLSVQVPAKGQLPRPQSDSGTVPVSTCWGPTATLRLIPEWHSEEATVTSSLPRSPSQFPGFPPRPHPPIRKTQFPFPPSHLSWMVHFVLGSVVPKKLTHLTSYRDGHR